jgi:hypothetical protein
MAQNQQSVPENKHLAARMTKKAGITHRRRPAVMAAA